MTNTIDWVNKIIDELTDPSYKLKDVLLKVQVLAFKAKNEKLKDWVVSEINGYKGKEVPKYRKVPTLVFGNLIQQGYKGSMVRNNNILPIEHLSMEFQKALTTIPLDAAVSQLEYMIEKGGDYQVSLPFFISAEISKSLGNDWAIDSSWQKISLNSIEGVLGSIKSTLLTFMLQLVDELGENDKVDIINNKKVIDSLFDNTIGNLSADTVNINIGSKDFQTINTGNNSNVNISKGDSNSLNISTEISSKLKEFIENIRRDITALNLSDDNDSDIKNEVLRIETQLSKEKPKMAIVNQSLKIIYDILVETTASVMSPTLVESAAWLIQHLKGWG